MISSVLHMAETEFAELAEAREPLDRFGPETERPLVIIHVDDGSAKLAEFARSLPCPVIAVGGGETPLGAACDVVVETRHEADQIAERVSGAPWTAMILVQHLRASEHLDVRDALIAESFAFATVQHGPDFQRWKQGAQLTEAPSCPNAPLRIASDGGILRLTMTDDGNLNAMGVAMRDALSEGLDLALADPAVKTVELRGEGRCFSVGGEPREFGQVADPVTAHWIRTLRLPASRAALLRARLDVHIDGAAVGAAIELAAFGKTVTATARSWFHLPELSYGLIPGAGGTVSIPRRIGRQRTALMVLSGKRIRASQALEWGLIDAIAS